MDVAVHLLHGTLGTSHLGGSSQLILTTGTVLGHLILALGSLALGLHSLVVGIDLVALLGRHHTLVKQTLDALIRLLGDFQSGLSLLPQLEGTLNLLLTGSVLGLQLQSGSSILSALGLFHLRTHLGGVQYGQCVADLHIVTLLHAYFQDASRHLARHAVFTDFHLSLNQFGITAQRKESYQGHDNHGCCKSDDCKQNVVMLCFC